MQTTCAELLIVEGGREEATRCCGVEEQLGEGPFEGRCEDRKGVARQTIGYF